MRLLKFLNPWGEIARLKSDVAGYSSALADEIDRTSELYIALESEQLMTKGLHERLNRQAVTISEGESEIARLKALIGPLDRDGDGKPGGSISNRRATGSVGVRGEAINAEDLNRNALHDGMREYDRFHTVFTSQEPQGGVRGSGAASVAKDTTKPVSENLRGQG